MDPPLLGETQLHPPVVRRRAGGSYSVWPDHHEKILVAPAPSDKPCRSLPARHCATVRNARWRLGPWEPGGRRYVHQSMQRGNHSTGHHCDWIGLARRGLGLHAAISNFGGHLFTLRLKFSSLLAYRNLETLALTSSPMELVQRCGRWWCNSRDALRVLDPEFPPPGSTPFLADRPGEPLNQPSDRRPT